ncbi:MAG: hypothetical protein P8Y53_20300 [Pseudolabrys sp.]
MTRKAKNSCASSEKDLAVLRLAATAIDLRKELSEDDLERFPDLRPALDRLEMVFTQMLRERATT